MARLRSVLVPVATMWLLCQSMTLTVALPAFWVQSAGVREMACTCVHGADGTCPMHRQTSAGSKLCLIHNVDDSGTSVLRSLLSPIGLIPRQVATTAPLSIGTQPIIAYSATTDRPIPPDPPPPRD